MRIEEKLNKVFGFEKGKIIKTNGSDADIQYVIDHIDTNWSHPVIHGTKMLVWNGFNGKEALELVSSNVEKFNACLNDILSISTFEGDNQITVDEYKKNVFEKIRLA